MFRRGQFANVYSQSLLGSNSGRFALPPLDPAVTDWPKRRLYLEYLNVEALGKRCEA
jgi:hypothetical protein